MSGSSPLTGLQLPLAGIAATRLVLSPSDALFDYESRGYRPVDGVLVPHRIRVQQGGTQQAEIVVTSVEFDVPADDEAFRLE